VQDACANPNAPFKQVQKNEQGLSDNEKTKQAEREKMARLKALRVAKNPT